MTENIISFQDNEKLQTPTILQLLVWEAAPLRLILEFSAMLVLYYSIMLQLPDSYRYNNTVSLALGIIIAVITIYVDRALLCKSHTLLEKSYDYAFLGKLDKAYENLKNLQFGLAPLPLHLYNIKAAELCYLKGEDYAAERHLIKARDLGVRSFECELIKMKASLCSSKGSDSINFEKEQCSLQPLWIIEKAMNCLFKKNDYASAKKYLEAAKILPNVLHSSSASTHDLCHLMSLCVGLHTGKAEQHLPQLDFLLSFIKYQAGSIPELRPYISFAYLERAKYYSRRKKNWTKAKADLDLALTFCRYPAHVESAKSISEKIA